MCSLSAGWLTPSFSASSAAQTPSRTRSPSTCGRKMLTRLLQPVEDLQAPLVGERAQRCGVFHQMSI